MRLTVVSLSPTISVVRVDRCQQQAYDAVHWTPRGGPSLSRSRALSADLDCSTIHRTTSTRSYYCRQHESEDGSLWRRQR